MSDDVIPCPACGGAGGGPFGRAGSAWDLETYECPRCQGAGTVLAAQPLATTAARPLAKGPVSSRPDPIEKRGPVRARAAETEVPAVTALNGRAKR